MGYNTKCTSIKLSNNIKSVYICLYDAEVLWNKLCIFTWTVVRCFPCVTSPVSQQVFLPCECFPTIKTVIRSLWFNAHVQLYMPVEMLSPTVCFGTALIGTAQLSLAMVVPTTTSSLFSTFPCMLLAKRVKIRWLCRPKNCHAHWAHRPLTLVWVVWMGKPYWPTGTMNISLMSC